MQRRLCSFDWPFLKISAMKHVFVLSQKPTHILPYHYRKEASLLFLVIWWIVLFEYLYSLIRAVSSYSPLPLGKSSAPKQNNFQLSPPPPPPLLPLLGISETDLVCIFSLLLARQIKWIQEFNNPERTVQIKRAFATQKKTIKRQTGSAWNFFQPQTQVCSRFLNLLFQINYSLLLLLPLFQRIFQSPDQDPQKDKWPQC